MERSADSPTCERCWLLYCALEGRLTAFLLPDVNRGIESNGATMGIQTHFEKFHNKIKLGREDDAYKKARERDDSIKKELISAFASAISRRPRLHPGFS